MNTDLLIQLNTMFIMIMIGCFYLVYLKVKGKPSPFRYDERQIIQRGIEFKYAYFTMMTCMVLNAFRWVDTGSMWADPVGVVSITIVCSIVVFAVYCIKHDAYISLNENINGCFFNLLFWIGLFLHRSLGESSSIFVNGELTGTGLSFIIIVGCIVLIATLFKKARQLQKEKIELEKESG